MKTPHRRRVAASARGKASPAGVWLLLATVLALGACSKSSETAPLAFPSAPLGGLEIRYPLDETLFPPEIVAPTFAWNDPAEGVSEWKVLLRFQGEEILLRFSTTEPRWRPSEADWAEIKRRSTEHEAEVAIVGVGARNAPASAAMVRIRTSTDPVGDSIFYREVPLPFLDVVRDPSRIRWRFGTIDSQESPPIVLENLPVCGNCHSFSRDGSVLGLDVDYGNDKGAYAVLPVSKEMVLDDQKIITWSDYKRNEGDATYGLLSQVSPDGRYAISTVKDRAVFVATPDIQFSQLFFPIKGILVVYDRETGDFKPLPGADDPAYVQSNPTWSPDGKYVVFARTKAYHKASAADPRGVLLNEKDVPEFVERREPFKFDLYRVPFNGGRGGTPEPIEGASHNGMSNYFAKFSPDGKWIVFCKAKDFMLLMPDSELHIIPAEGGEARRLRANTPLMNSWHSFSSNGRWLVFSSKAYTPYTQLFLTHIDEQGNSTPPVVLERFTAADRAANIPEFVPLAPDSIAKIREQFLDAYSFLRAGMANERTGNYPGAIRLYRRGLELEPDNVEILNAIGFSLFQQGKSQEAVVELEKALAIDPKHWKSHNNMALASIDLGELEMAEAHYRESLAIKPQPAIYNDLGFVLERQGLTEEAIRAYRQAIELEPRLATANYNLGSALARSGQYAEAERYLRAAVDADPKNAAARQKLAEVLQSLERREEARSETGSASRVQQRP